MQALPARPNFDWLRKIAKERLAELRSSDPAAKLFHAQLLVAREHGFKNWRDMKARIEEITGQNDERRRAFDAAEAGDTAAVRRALERGFDPATANADGRTIYQIAKEKGFGDIEILARDLQQRPRASETEAEALRGIVRAAQAGDVPKLAALLDAHPDLIDGLAGGLSKATALHLAALRSQHDAVRLLIERGASLDKRDFPDNAAPLHFAAAHADLETVRLLVEAGADVDGKGDDYGVGVIGWATCLRQVRTDVAEYLLAHGAALNLWSAIALDRETDVRRMIEAEPSLLAARMSRNLHRRTPLHHAAAKNRARMVRLLLELGAGVRATDATGATALTTASQENADAEVIDALLAAGAPLDFLTAINLGRYREAEAMLREDPSRIGPDGGDTIALHLAVNKRNATAVRWLIAHGVDVSAKRMMWDCNHTALHMCVESGAEDLLRLLLDAGADPTIEDDKFHSTVLGWARYFGRDEMAKVIEAHGGHA